MKNAKLNKLLCKIFGHKTTIEVYATEYRYSRVFRYIVHTTEVCERCGKVINHTESRPMSRTEMLKNGWFIEN